MLWVVIPSAADQRSMRSCDVVFLPAVVLDDADRLAKGLCDSSSPRLHDSTDRRGDGGFVPGNAAMTAACSSVAGVDEHQISALWKP